MDKTKRRLLEIIGHLDAITEQMKTDSNIPIKGVLMDFYAEEIKGLVEEMKGLLDSASQ